LRNNLNKIFDNHNIKILLIILISIFLNITFFFNINKIYSLNENNKKIGILKPVVLLVEFPDLKANFEISTPNFYNNILFEKNKNSFYDYFYENSQGKLEIIGKVYSNSTSNSLWFMAPKEYEYYENNFYGMGKYPNNTQKLVEDIIEYVDGEINFSDYDGDNDGFVDGIIIIYAGSSISNDEFKKIYPHMWMINSIKKDNKYISKFIVIPEYKFKPGDFTIGPLCHEFGHILGGIDLYDLDSHKSYIYDNQISNGLGKWSLMSNGIWGKRNIRGDSPSHLDVWHKILFGWLDPIVIENREIIVNLNPIELKDGNVIKIILNKEPEEYLLIENRQRINFDSDLPKEGVLIYHVDESILNNCYAYSPFYETPNKSHYKVSIVQKDNFYELERGKNLGDEKDVFIEGDKFILKQNNKSISYYNKNINVIINIIDKTDLSYQVKIEITNQ